MPKYSNTNKNEKNSFLDLEENLKKRMHIGDLLVWTGPDRLYPSSSSSSSDLLTEHRLNPLDDSGKQTGIVLEVNSWGIKVRWNLRGACLLHNWGFLSSYFRMGLLRYYAGKPNT